MTAVGGGRAARRGPPPQPGAPAGPAAAKARRPAMAAAVAAVVALGGGVVLAAAAATGVFPQAGSPSAAWAGQGGHPPWAARPRHWVAPAPPPPVATAPGQGDAAAAAAAAAVAPAPRSVEAPKAAPGRPPQPPPPLRTTPSPVSTAPFSHWVPAVRHLLEEEYPAWHAAQAANASVPVLVYTYQTFGNERGPPQGMGLGDVFKSITLAYQMAVATRRLFFIDWDDEEWALTDVLVPAGRVDWRWAAVAGVHGRREAVAVDGLVSPDGPRRLVNGSAIPLPGGGAFDVRADDPDAVWRAASGGGPAPVLRWRVNGNPLLGSMADNPHLGGLAAARAARAGSHFKSTWYEAQVVDVSRLLFAPSPALSAAAAAERAALGMAPAARYVGVHGRFGGPLMRERLAGWRAWDVPLPVAAAGLADCVAGKAAATMAHAGWVRTVPCRLHYGRAWDGAAAATVTGVYVASDTPAFAAAFRAEATRRGWAVAVSRQRAAHIGKMARDPGGTGARRRALFAALLDIALLGGGDALIGVASGFSATAYGLTNTSSLVWLSAPQPPQ
ncbi:hypothetical protein I4F81_004609 [Pyropia yezoensis]|uniref:Uncharacterized protein n=1 Tax=Pyropia yezoensis TaxID=2788 RepID=A0ACC3BWP4_PYRYE|nr:hypothetical protein I4F81_004609 [Neopyropia yezoensis]